jgi:hypothetical protein
MNPKRPERPSPGSFSRVRARSGFFGKTFKKKQSTFKRKISPSAAGGENGKKFSMKTGILFKKTLLNFRGVPRKKTGPPRNGKK